jgi:O-antigen/teichoic acid export membrane protein
VLLGSASGLILHLFGKDFHVGQPVVWMLLLSTIPESLANALFQDIFTRGRLWLAVATVNIPRETTFVLLASLWVPHIGAMGLARAYCAASVLELSVILILTAGLRRSDSALSTA